MKVKFRSLRTKLVVLCLFLLLVPTILIGITTYESSKSKLDEAGKKQLQHSVKAMIGMMNVMDGEVKAGRLTLEEAQEKVRQELLGQKDAKNVRPIKQAYTVGTTGYPWAVNKNSISVMNPNNEGEDLTNIKSQDGVMLGKAIVEMGIKGGGFLSYQYKIPGDSNKVETKISYVEMDPNWGWIVGSGAHVTEFNAGAQDVLKLVLWIGSIALVLGMFIVSFFSSRLAKPIQLIGRKLNEVATGNFTVEEVHNKSKDEVGELARDFNNMVKQMRHFIGEVNASTQQVASYSNDLMVGAEQTSKATEQITIAIQESADGVEEQRITLEQTTTSLVEMSIGIQRIAESSSTIADSSADTRNIAGLGGVAIQNTVKQMSSISESVNDSNEVIQLLEQRTAQIDQVLTIIRNISSQTNMLALNAGIEAARAGEHGKGFAVVAGEVRKLADQSNSSTNEISSLIEEMQNDMKRSVQTMNKVKEEVLSGTEVAKETELRFQDITTSTIRISEQIEELASITQQISASVQEISASGENVANIAKIASSHSQEIASSAEEQLASMEEVSGLASNLSHMSGDLQQLINRFKF
ncbi:methyl-accepting chemotaxis protein [Paenibacillus sp. IHBB 10380]|uniref:methyl-accepting chemotaxis protein n=1 Tax=Paenibacillus sp. IHBB 10380 TaxID=1566358 RepID=UPI0005CFA78A|nr:methyl-accepting chemotaxis protein [Paenibacillus sp. IHBB 10380]AJS58095.1 chemotaxis protein [Paenibacillus sp. IHBB 10380]